MPKKAKKTQKIAVLSDSDDEEDFKNPRKKGHKYAISDSDDDDLSSPKPSTSKGKICTLIVDHCHFTYSRIFWCLRMENL